MSINTDKISPTEFFILFWGSLLPPLTESLLSATAQSGGRAGILSPLWLLPGLILLGLLLNSLGKSGGKLGFLSSFGQFGGRFFHFLFFFWGIFLLSLRLLLSTQRFLAVGYEAPSLYFLLPALALFVFWMAGSSLAAFSRCASLYFLPLFLMILLILGISLPKVELLRVFPLWTQDLAPSLWGALPLYGVCSYGIYASFFLSQVEWEDKNPKKLWIFWCSVACLFLSLFLFVGIGNFGAPFLAEMDQPFFLLAQGIRVQGAFQRIESLVSALWTLADFILLGVLIRSCSHCGAVCLGWENTRLFTGILLVISTILALFLPDLQEIGVDLALGGNLLFAVVIPLLAGLCSWLRKKSLHF